MSFLNFFGIFLGCMTLNIECLYMTMALKVHWSQYNAILPLKNDDLFVAVDMITVVRMKGKIGFSTVVSLVPVSNMSPSLVASSIWYYVICRKRGKSIWGRQCPQATTKKGWKPSCWPTSMIWGAGRDPRRGWGCWRAASTPRTARAWQPALGCAECDAASPQSACNHTWMRLLGQFKWITLKNRIGILWYCGKYLWFFWGGGFWIRIRKCKNSEVLNFGMSFSNKSSSNISKIFNLLTRQGQRRILCYVNVTL